MALIKHQFYRFEIIAAIWMTAVLLVLGALVFDGGYIAALVLISASAFWIGAIPPMLRKERRKTDRLYLKYGLIATFLLTIVVIRVLLGAE